MRGAHLAWRLSRPKENSKQKETRAHTQLHMLREPGLLRSVLITALDLAHVHAAPANSALFLPEVSLFAFVFWSAAAVPAVFFAVGTWFMAVGEV